MIDAFHYVRGVQTSVGVGFILRKRNIFKEIDKMFILWASNRMALLVGLMSFKAASSIFYTFARPAIRYLESLIRSSGL